MSAAAQEEGRSATWTPLDPSWTRDPVDLAEDLGSMWAESGGAWLSEAGVQVPATAVREILRLVRYLDSKGAGLAGLFGAGGLGLLGERAACGSKFREKCDKRSNSSSRLIRAADGWVAVSLARADDIASIPAWLGVAYGDGSWSTVERVISARTVQSTVDQGVLLGLPVAGVGEIVDRRGVLVQQLEDSKPQDAGMGRALEGVTVVNLASLWAGPVAADVLARLGARVLTVESTHRPDGSRATPRFFEALHGRSESVAIDFQSHQGRRQLAQLLGSVDVVIEGSRPRALEQLGIDAVTLASVGPRVWASITAYGREGAGAQRVGFGDDCAAAGGLVGWVDGCPTFLADAIADPIAGLTTAATVVHLLASGGRWIADLALSRLSASVNPIAGELARIPSPGLFKPPHRRCDAGSLLPLGRDTAAVLKELQIEGALALSDCSRREI